MKESLLQKKIVFFRRLGGCDQDEKKKKTLWSVLISISWFLIAYLNFI